MKEKYSYVYVRDGKYEIEDLWSPFTADKCPSLAGKPKWFIVQVSMHTPSKWI